jgi:hypothetical protein
MTKFVIQVQLRVGLVAEEVAEPALGRGQGPAFALGVVLDLVAVDAADAEVGRLGMGEVVAADRGGRLHGEALGQVDIRVDPAQPAG